MIEEYLSRLFKFAGELGTAYLFAWVITRGVRHALKGTRIKTDNDLSIYQAQTVELARDFLK